MKILLASSELHPYSKTGGLADMVAALAKALATSGNEVGVVTPAYAGLFDRFPQLKKLDWFMELPLGEGRVRAEVWTLQPQPNLTVYFINYPPFFERRGLYNDHGGDYPDNAERFIFFSKAVVHLARYLPWRPEIVQSNDWQTGLVSLLISDQKLRDGWLDAPRTCFTIHNLAYQGVFPGSKYKLTNLPADYFNPSGAEFYQQLNCLKAGIAFSDVITTVSPRYAREITTPEFGCALDDLLRRRQKALFGILNGVDYDEWNTTHNKFLPQPYSIDNLAGKAADKAALQTELNLPVSPHVPVFASITRLADQKGVDIQLAALEEMLSADLQFVLLGSGADYFENAYRRLAKRYPSKVAIRLDFNQGLSHRIEAGADFFLMPSRFEPCGLNQMYSLRYGTIPIVRITGGLDDTVIDVTEDAEHANGIKFLEYSGRALARCIRKALVLYGEPELLAHYRTNGMAADFSWDKLVKQYLQVYRAG